MKNDAFRYISLESALFAKVPFFFAFFFFGGGGGGIFGVFCGARMQPLSQWKLCDFVPKF